jgi:hypothetical protein
MRILIKGDGVTGVRRIKTYVHDGLEATVTTEPTRTCWERLFSYVVRWGREDDGSRTRHIGVRTV